MTRRAVGTGALAAPESAVSAYLETLLGPSGGDGGRAPKRIGPGAGGNPGRGEWSRARLLTAGGSRVLLPETRIEAVLEAPVWIRGDLPAPFCGLLQHAGRRVVCVDLEALAAPGPETALPREGAGGCAVLIGAGRWALRCDAVTEPMAIDAGGLRWRSGRRSMRPWLAGISLPLRCGLIDADVLIPWLWERLRDGGTPHAAASDGAAGSHTPDAGKRGPK